MRVSGWRAPAASALATRADIIAVPDRAFDGAALLVSVPQGSIDEVRKALLGIGASIRSAALVGSHATRYTLPQEKRVPAAKAPGRQAGVRSNKQ
jgi:hypothetical protein